MSSNSNSPPSSKARNHTGGQGGALTGSYGESRGLPLSQGLVGAKQHGELPGAAWQGVWLGIGAEDDQVPKSKLFYMTQVTSHDEFIEGQRVLLENSFAICDKEVIVFTSKALYIGKGDMS